MSRFALITAALMAVPAVVILTAGAAAASTTDQREVCQRTVVCAPVNAPVDVGVLRNVIVILGR